MAFTEKVDRDADEIVAELEELIRAQGLEQAVVKAGEIDPKWGDELRLEFLLDAYFKANDSLSLEELEALVGATRHLSKRFAPLIMGNVVEKFGNIGTCYMVCQYLEELLPSETDQVVRSEITTAVSSYRQYIFRTAKSAKEFDFALKVVKEYEDNEHSEHWLHNLFADALLAGDSEFLFKMLRDSELSEEFRSGHKKILETVQNCSGRVEELLKEAEDTRVYE